MRKSVALISAVVVASLLVTSASGIGGTTSKLPSKAENFSRLSGKQVKAPSARTAVPRGRKGTKLKIFESNVFGVSANGREDVFMKCPRGFVAINGYFGTDGLIFSDYSAQAPNVRIWELGLADLSGENGQAFMGLICLKP